MSNIENLPPYQAPEQPTTPPTLGHSGSLEGPMKEQGLPDAPKIVPGMDIPETVYDGFETRPPEDYERGPMDQGKAAVRDSYTLAPEAPKKSKRGLWISLGAGAASLLVAGGAIFGVNAAKDGNKTETTPPDPSKTVASALATPSAQESASPIATETAPVVSSYELAAGQSPEALAKDYMSVTNDWVNAGCNPDTVTASNTGAGMLLTPEEFSLKVATEEGKKRAIALLGPDYESNPALANYAKNMIAQNANVLNLYIRTSLGNTTGFYQKYTFDKMTSSSVDGPNTTLVFEGHLDNNSEDSPNVVQYEPSGTKLTYALTFVKHGNVEFLTSAGS